MEGLPASALASLGISFVLEESAPADMVCGCAAPTAPRGLILQLHHTPSHPSGVRGGAGGHRPGCGVHDSQRLRCGNCG